MGPAPFLSERTDRITQSIVQCIQSDCSVYTDRLFNVSVNSDRWLNVSVLLMKTDLFRDLVLNADRLFSDLVLIMLVH